MAYEKYEEALGEFGEYIPYKTFESEAGMRRGAQIGAVKAGLTRQLREAEPEGATATYMRGGQASRGSALAHYGRRADAFARGRGKVAGVEARATGDVVAEEQLEKRKYNYERMLDQIDARKAEITAKREFDKSVIKGAAQVGTMAATIGAMGAVMGAKYDAMKKSKSPEEVEELLDEQEKGINEAGLEDERRRLSAEKLDISTAEEEKYLGLDEPFKLDRDGRQVAETEFTRRAGEKHAASLISKARREYEAAKGLYEKVHPIPHKSRSNLSGSPTEIDPQAAAKRLRDSEDRLKSLLRAFGVMGGYEESLQELATRASWAALEGSAEESMSEFDPEWRHVWGAGDIETSGDPGYISSRRIDWGD